MATAQPANNPPPASTQEPSPTTPSTSGVPPPSAAAAATVARTLPLNIGNEQVMAILKNVPGLFQTDGTKDVTAAEALSNLAQSAYTHQLSSNVGQPLSMPSSFQVHAAQFGEPGPSSHPIGPPNLAPYPSGQNPPPLSAIRTDVDNAKTHNEAPPHPGTSGAPPPPAPHSAGSESPDQHGDGEKPRSGGRRGGRSTAMSNDEWARIRKDNHKEVERRRRGNINEGINELGRIVPNGSGEKAKGAILSRAVQYIHHLKENEARNIEKWTLEKLLMDQAMGDLQAQLEEMRKLWDEERQARQKLEVEVDALRAKLGQPAESTAAATATASGNGRSGSPPPAENGTGTGTGTRDGAVKRAREEALSVPATAQEGEADEERTNFKRQRTE